MEALKLKWQGLSYDSRLRLVVICLLAAICIPAVVFIVYRSIFSATINLVFAPKSAETVTIGGKNAKFGENNIIPGEYEVVVEKKGFEPYKEKVTIKFGETKSVEVAMVSNDPSTADWYQKNIDDYTIAQGIGDRRAEAANRHRRETFPVAKHLPIVGLYSTYRVDYGLSPNNNQKYALYITYDSEAYKQEALKALKLKGINVDDYEVIYSENKPQQIDGVAISGLVGFSEKGLSENTVDIIRTYMTDYFSKKYGGQGVSVSISGLTQTIMEDVLSEVYAATLVVGSDRYSMHIDTSFDNMTIRVDSVVIYDGARESHTDH